ncbi:hypothetical protein IW140_004775 [Coemansia sp. RSA 1813]|nr:hypothetical protein EV178_001882 [Coemansia sp. RSA 1646]KAJ1770019.1 hypothetical protein LPJ74_003526 [Coemansia sp. RSA 1843]KAJ2093059.1 hypothetical protein IW138_000773 [Coemansia sp. RSA 986]KAJ2211525.1 hypothetical protein EV179_005423 [Coemansia sp. RSA 487]KAJ2566773.1 hypothetical protein IW140_004775 [Coemansia sp. RSA 1813]
MNPQNGFSDFAKKLNQFGNQLGDNIKRVFNEGQNPSRLVSSSDDVLGLDAEAFREATIEGNDGGELATYVNEKLVYEAGVDYESRPMLVFSACRMLNPDVVDYDRLLNLILFRLDDFVESDYTVVLLAASPRYKPNIKWLYTAYRKLGRKYKKNLKALYIVHPSKWVQILMSAMNAVLSPKFAKKVQWVDTLSDLARRVPIDQINIPPEVYQFNATKETEIRVPSHGSSSNRFFGVPLERLMGVHGELGLPAPAADALDYLYTNALQVQDLFRRSPPSATLQKVRSQYEVEGHISITYAVWGEHVAAAILKTWCRELPHPIIPSHYYELIREMPSPDKQSDQAADYARDVVLPALSDPPCVALLLAALFGLLRAVADHSNVNNMTSAKLAAAWAPNFVRSSQPDVDISMCSVTRFAEAPVSVTRHSSRNNREDISSYDSVINDDDDDDDDENDYSDRNENDTNSIVGTDEQADENRPNVVTLAKLMIDQYQTIFKPTLEAAEALTKQQSQRMGAGNSDKNNNNPPPKPPRHNVPADRSRSAADGEISSTQVLAARNTHASDDDIAALVEEFGSGAVLKSDSASKSNAMRLPVTAEDITKRLKTEQEEAVQRAKQDAEAKSSKDIDNETDEIIIGASPA